MDYGEMDTIKVEKMMAMKKFKRNRKAKKYLRYLAVALSAVLLSWSSVWIPIVVQTTAIYIRFACSLVTSSRFVFIMCNVIILTLAAKSGQLSGPSGGSNPGSPDLYEEFIKNAENRPKLYVLNLSEQDEEVLEKQCISEEVPATDGADQPEEIKTTVPAEEVIQTMEIVEAEVACSSRRRIGRSKSAKQVKKPAQKLRRSETGIENHYLLPGNSNSSVSEMAESNEGDDVSQDKQFEEFIASMHDLHRQESIRAMVNV